MTHPVIDSLGHTYERDEIEEWFRRGGRTSPCTGQMLPNQLLIPNHALRAMIMAANDAERRRVERILLGFREARRIQFAARIQRAFRTHRSWHAHLTQQASHVVSAAAASRSTFDVDEKRIDVQAAANNTIRLAKLRLTFKVKGVTELCQDVNLNLARLMELAANCAIFQDTPHLKEALDKFHEIP